jgi:hypothetical protein
MIVVVRLVVSETSGGSSGTPGETSDVELDSKGGVKAKVGKVIEARLYYLEIVFGVCTVLTNFFNPSLVTSTKRGRAKDK